MSLLSPLDADQQATFLVVALPRKTLRKLVGKLGTAPKGTRLDTLNEWQLADSLVDYYHDDVEVAADVDRQLEKELGPSPFAAAVADAATCRALADLLREAPDPLRDLAWAILAHGPDDAGETAASLAQTVIAQFDAADERTKAEAADAAEASEEPADPTAPDDATTRELAREAARARTARSRALKRLGGVKERLAEVEERLGAVHEELRGERSAHDETRREAARAREEIDSLRAALQGGAAAEAARLADALAAAERRIRSLEGELEERHEAEETLAARVRELEARRPSAGAAADEPSPERGTGTWSLPIFTDEFYDSLRGWDRRIVRTAFEKIHRLADDWRHPSLRAIPLEGLPGHHRIRIASDVRLIYRPADGGRVEILSLIDREDLQRYIRTAKTRQTS